ncbi:MAG: hypothetical protein RJA98_853 [Pseudomonadota bacterium]|jgi:uncharacterized cupredoxin-like copper-binding protein
MTDFKLHPLALAFTAAAALLLSTGPALAGGNAADGHTHGAAHDTMHDAMMKNGMAADMHAHAAGHEHGDASANPVGEPGEAAQVNRTVRITMADTMRYRPARVAVKQGETIRFDVRNAGALKHELVLGTHQALIEHAEMMKKMPEMEHDDPQMVTVQPGDRGEIVWHFTQAGTIEFACLQPGHFEAGMKGAVAVQPAPGAKKKPARIPTATATGAAHDHAH